MTPNKTVVLLIKKNMVCIFLPAFKVFQIVFIDVITKMWRARKL